MASNHIDTRVDGTTLWVTINRPGAMNALDPAAHRDLGIIFDGYARRQDLRVAVITGAGEKAFCAGSDLKARETAGGDDLPDTGFAGLTERFDLHKPVIAAVNGNAIGGGLEMVLACDLAIAVRHAKFGLPEPRVGLAATGGLHRLARQIPLKYAMEIALTGRMFDADEACRFGLINQVVEAGELSSAVDALIAELNRCAPLSLRATKQMMLDGLSAGSLKMAFEARYPALDDMLTSADAREGPRAFIEKRKPVWQGR
jgi:crotonobetainyl-CoA hydratase